LFGAGVGLELFRRTQIGITIAFYFLFGQNMIGARTPNALGCPLGRSRKAPLPGPSGSSSLSALRCLHMHTTLRPVHAAARSHVSPLACNSLPVGSMR
jgi:hypothetical protein